MDAVCGDILELFQEWVVLNRKVSYTNQPPVGKVKFSKIVLKHGDTMQYMAPPFARLKLKAMEYNI